MPPGAWEGTGGEQKGGKAASKDHIVSVVFGPEVGLPSTVPDTMRTRGLLASLAAIAVVFTPTAAAAATPVGPLAQGPRSEVGGQPLSRTGVVRSRTEGVPPLPAVSATSFLVADLESGAVLAARDAHGRYRPASTIKVLTAIALMPRIAPSTRVRPAAVDVNIEGSKVGLVTQISYPASQLFTAMLVASGNDAAGALATAVGGMPVAARLMNAEAERLHAFDTQAVNTSGLDAPGQLSSAYDLALIAREGMRRPQFRAYVSTRRALISAPDGKTIEIANHNKLLGSYQGALGVKNGYTSKARSTFIGAAERGGRSILITMMRANSRPHTEAAQLLDWGFAAVAAGAQPIGRLVEPDPLPVLASVADSVTALAGSGASASAASGLDDEQSLPILPALILLLGAAAGVLLVGKHHQLTELEQRAMARRLR